MAGGGRTSIGFLRGRFAFAVLAGSGVAEQVAPGLGFGTERRLAFSVARPGTDRWFFYEDATMAGADFKTWGRMQGRPGIFILGGKSQFFFLLFFFN